MTTIGGHERLERARDRFALAVKEREDEEPQRKRHRPEGEGRQPLAPPASGVRSNCQEGSSSSGSALPPPPAPPPLEPPQVAKNGVWNRKSAMDKYLEVRTQAEDKQYSSCPLIQETKVTKILNILTSLYHVERDTCTVHGRTSRRDILG